MQFREVSLYWTYLKEHYIRKISFILLFFACAFIYGDEYIIGGEKGWSDIEVLKYVTTGPGRFGYEGLMLDSNLNRVEDDTDMLLTFEGDNFFDLCGNYIIEENNLFKSNRTALGKQCALSRSKNGGIILTGQKGSFFSSEGRAGSFFIEFWICPSVVENGEVIIKWRSSRNISNNIEYQLINASFYQDRLMVSFSNIFDGYTKDGGDVTLLGRSKLIPNKWTMHTIIFEEDTGSLSYRVNGILEDSKFMTTTGHEGSTTYTPILGVQASLELCPKYTGLMDDFKVLRSYSNIARHANSSFQNEIDFSPYRKDGGRFVSKPVQVKAKSRLKYIKIDDDSPKETAINYFVRGGDNYYGWTDQEPEWRKVHDGEEIKNLTGKFFQIATDLFPSGDGYVSPRVSRIVLDYEALPHPVAPYNITATSYNESVTLRWSYPVDNTTGGYYIYYGTKSGEYLGSIAMEGVSPINVGNINYYSISGLENGKIYYFAIRSYSQDDSSILSELSREVFARPGSRLN